MGDRRFLEMSIFWLLVMCVGRVWRWLFVSVWRLGDDGKGEARGRLLAALGWLRRHGDGIVIAEHG